MVVIQLCALVKIHSSTPLQRVNFTEHKSCVDTTDFSEVARSNYVNKIIPWNGAILYLQGSADHLSNSLH